MTYDEIAGWADRATDLRLRFVVTAYLLRWTCNRALQILGEGRSEDKIRRLTETTNLEVLWREMLENRLGVAYRSLREVVEIQSNVEFKDVMFGSFVAIQRMEHGFPIPVSENMRNARNKVKQIRVAAKRVREYVASFGIDFGAKINQRNVQTAIDRAQGR